MINGICSCSNPIVVDPGPKPCQDPECLYVPHLLIKEDQEKNTSSILPCNETLVVDLHGKIKLSDTTESSVATIEIVSHTDNLKNVSFLSNSDNSVMQISMMSNYQGYPNTDYKFGKIVYRVYQGLLAKEATITIIFKNACETVNNLEEGYCDPCTGLVILPDPEIKVSEFNNLIPEIKIL